MAWGKGGGFRVKEEAGSPGRSRTPEAFGKSRSEISIAWLRPLLGLHRRPIDVVVFHDPQGRTHLGRDLALRCFQRLFLPHSATRPCSWRNNRFTVGASDPVLSY